MYVSFMLQKYGQEKYGCSNLIYRSHRKFSLQTDLLILLDDKINEVERK